MNAAMNAAVAAVNNQTNSNSNAAVLAMQQQMAAQAHLGALGGSSSNQINGQSVNSNGTDGRCNGLL